MRIPPGWPRFLLIFLSVYALSLALYPRMRGPLGDEAFWDTMGYVLAPALLLGWYLGFGGTGPRNQLLSQVAIWVGLLLLLVFGYGYRAELVTAKDRFLAVLMPQRGYGEEPGSMNFFRSNDGHFHIEAEVNGRPVRFLVDTGATDIVLTLDVARTLGFDPRRLDFSKTYHTANGTVRGAPVFLRSLRVGELHLNDVPASVNAGRMNGSLLGMRFFNRLPGYRVKKNVLTIYWQPE